MACSSCTSTTCQIARHQALPLFIAGATGPAHLANNLSAQQIDKFCALLHSRKITELATHHMLPLQLQLLIVHWEVHAGHHAVSVQKTLVGEQSSLVCQLLT